ncbi:MAG: 6,7-dimethyl-8-ribityllumazine synthase [Candidatus Micrarchaeia archaeon]
MVKIAIIVSEFNSEITQKMEKSALETCERKKVEIVKLVHVPGAYDMALVASELAKKTEVQAVVCLGAIVKGETKHDEIIAGALANSLSRISIESRKPVLFGIIGPGATQEQAHERALEYGERCVISALKMIGNMKDLVK